jgi:hypothetical protein
MKKKVHFFGRRLGIAVMQNGALILCTVDIYFRSTAVYYRTAKASNFAGEKNKSNRFSAVKEVSI